MCCAHNQKWIVVNTVHNLGLYVDFELVKLHNFAEYFEYSEQKLTGYAELSK